MPQIQIYLRNNDPFPNTVRAFDTNNADAEIWNGPVNALQQQQVLCQTDSSGYGNIVTSTDTNPRQGHFRLMSGDRCDL